MCSRPFKYVNDLKRHRSIHFDDKPFECEICGKKFKHKSNLKTHQLTHYSEKPYSCTLCEKRFHQKGNLKTHLIVHTGEMPFVCNICTKRSVNTCVIFSQRRNLTSRCDPGTENPANRLNRAKLETESELGLLNWSAQNVVVL